MLGVGGFGWNTGPYLFWVCDIQHSGFSGHVVTNYSASLTNFLSLSCFFCSFLLTLQNKCVSSVLFPKNKVEKVLSSTVKQKMPNSEPCIQCVVVTLCSREGMFDTESQACFTLLKQTRLKACSAFPHFRDNVTNVWGIKCHNETPEVRWLIRIFGALSFVMRPWEIFVFLPCFISLQETFNCREL